MPSRKASRSPRLLPNYRATEVKIVNLEGSSERSRLYSSEVGVHTTVTLSSSQI